MRATALPRTGTAMPTAVLVIGGLLTLGLCGIASLVAIALTAPPPAVCAISLPARSSALGAPVELQERLAQAGCRAGDALAVLGDIHLHALARACDPARPVAFKPAAAETGRPAGAMCTHAGPMLLRGP
jgi:hypothetical protein